MSAPRLISPLLDNFVMGEPIFDQGGVRILPAMEEKSGEKHIVKILSIPATQTQVDALLITGAYKDADAVNGYFAELADAVIREAGVLTQLSSSGGFDGYANWQVVPMDDGNGYDVYLLGAYHPTWDRVSQQKTISHLDGYNLALDICAALSIARRNGYIYANLKPESVNVSPAGGYRICDLGLISANYLQYSSLPTAYFSAYTAPEVADAYSSLNSTLDVYALGMMLYEIFNGGLPFDGGRASASEYPAPAYADEEFAQIILKAINPDPAERWQDPTQMGQAIVSVMQRNGVSDAPIVPVAEPVATQDEPISEEVEVPPAEDEVTIEETIVDEPVTTENEGEPTAEAISAEETCEVDAAAEAATEYDKPDETAAETSGSDLISDEAVVSNETVVDDICVDALDTTVSEEVSAETSPSDEELDNILEEADKLIADLDINLDENTEEADYEQLSLEDPDEEAEEPTEDVPAGEVDEQDAPAPKSGKRKVLIACSVVFSVLLIICGLFFYRHVYMQEVDLLSVNGIADRIVIAVVTDIDSEKLTVVCTDSDGNAFEADLVNYRATISGLNAETEYTVILKIDGFHKLFGQTEYQYVTPIKTVIADLAILNGPEEGTADVSFRVEGPNEGNWTVTFTAQDEQPHTATAINGKATVAGLTLGKAYKVSLKSSADLYLDSGNEITFTPGSVVKPVEPYVESCLDGKLTVRWSAPAGYENASWLIRCYNELGFDETVTVNDVTVSFDVPDSQNAYTVEISAESQSAKETLTVTQNAITLSDFAIDTSLPGRITLSWTTSSEIPEGGYVISYMVDGIAVEDTIQTDSNSFTLLHAVPGAIHTFRFASANGESVLTAPVCVTATAENPFSAFGIKANNMRFNLCPRPTKTNWAYKDVSTSAYTTTFSVGQKAGVVGRIISKYYTSSEIVATVYVFKNTDGTIAHTCFTEEKWGDMWDAGYGTFDIPSLPNLPGSYNLDMYIDGGLAYQTSITMK